MTNSGLFYMCMYMCMYGMLVTLPTTFYCVEETIQIKFSSEVGQRDVLQNRHTEENVQINLNKF